MEPISYEDRISALRTVLKFYASGKNYALTMNSAGEGGCELRDAGEWAQDALDADDLHAAIQKLDAGTLETISAAGLALKLEADQ